MNTLVIITRKQEEFETLIKARQLPDLEVHAPKSDEEIEQIISKADILLANPLLTAKWINKASNLKWMQSTFAGVDAMCEDGLKRDYRLTNVRDTYGPPIAEYVMGYILYFLREINENRAAQRNKQWSQHPYETLQGRTLVVLGAGSIGKEIARVAKSFGMNTLGYKTSHAPVEHFDQIYSGDELTELLGKGDYVVNVLPNTQATKNIMNADTMAAMQPSAIFFNVGRGTAVNEDALAKAIKEGKLAKAVLDVFQTEPLPTESPLWELENVYITPHVSGYIMTDRFTEIFEENYQRFRKGKELMYLVDLEKGY